MKKLLLLIFGILVLIYCQTAHGQNYDYLESVTATGNGITTDNSQAWTNLFSVTIDVTDISYLLVTASINMRPDGVNTQAREANYNIYRSDDSEDKSGVIKRQIKHNNETGVESWGIGTLVHIFDVSSLTGNKTYTLEHSNKGGVTTARNVYSSARLTAVALSTEINHHELSNDVKRIDLDAETTTSSTFEAVSGLTTDAITLPINGDIFVIASINGKATENTSTVAEYKLEYSDNDGVDWADLGKSVKRSMVNSWDDGIVSLTCMLQDQVADNDFKFRVAHKRESGTGTVTTHNCNLCAVALAHSGGGYFPTFYSEVGSTGVNIVGLTAPAASVTSTSFTAAADISTTGTSLFVSSQYLVSASNLYDGGAQIQRMRAENQLTVSGASSASAEEYYRYIPDNSNFGAGGFIGLMEDLVSSGSYTIKMQHQIAALPGTASGGNDETLTTSEVILTGFQTYDQPHFVWDGGDGNSDWATADNWLYDEAPTAASTFDVTIPNVANDPSISGTTLQEVNDLFITDGVLTIEDDAMMTVNGDLSNTSGTLTLESTATGTGSLIVEGTATGDVKVERFLTHDRWHYIAGQTNISGFFSTLAMNLSGGTNGDQFYRWEESLDWGENIGNWVDILNGPNGNDPTFASEGFVICKGYAINYITDDETLILSGVPYIANQNITLTKTTNSTGEGSNLVGNPFSSTIAINDDADADNNFLDQNAAALDDSYEAIYIWNESNDWNGTTNADYDTYSNSLGGAFFASPGQAFMIMAASNDATLNFNTSLRKQGTSTFYKNSNNNDISRLKISVKNSDNQGNKTSIVFRPGMTKGLDPSYDVGKLKGNPDIALYTQLIEDNGIDFAIQALPDQDVESYVIPVGVDVSESSVFEFSATQENLDNYSLILEDRQENTFTDLRRDTYFATISESGMGRFYIHFKDATGIGGNSAHAAISLLYRDGQVQIQNPENQKGIVRLINIAGQVLDMQTLTGNNQQKFSVHQSEGIYIVDIQTDKAILSRKIIIN